MPPRWVGGGGGGGGREMEEAESYVVPVYPVYSLGTAVASERYPNNFCVMMGQLFVIAAKQEELVK